LAWLKGLQAKRTVPLMEQHQYWDAEAGESGALVVESRPVDYKGLEERISWLDEDVADCTVKLEGLTNE
jgi:hypothetical protein